MRTIICDKCGKEAEEENNVSVLEPRRCDNSDGHRFTIQLSYDLCDECIAKLIKWIEAENTQS